MDKKLAVIPMVALALLLVGIVAFTGPTQATTTPTTTSDDLDYTGQIRVIVERPGVGVIHDEINHNVLTNEGKEWVETLLSVDSSGKGQMTYIGLSNNATHNPVATDNATYWKGVITETTGNGLDRTTGTVANPNAGVSGNWSVTNAFSVTGSVSGIEIAGLFNDTYANVGEMLATANFTSVNVENGDTLTIVWNVSVA